MYFDATRGKLNVPPTFVSYMEKHKIYNIFHELACELIINKPKDHILFLKRILTEALKNKEVIRLVFLAPPLFEKHEVVKHISLKTGAQIYTPKDIQAILQPKDRTRNLTAKKFAQYLNTLVRNKAVMDSGWILVDMPQNKQQALAMQRIGILPTHVLQLIHVNETEKPSGQDHSSISYDLYKKNLYGLREAFHNRLKEIYMQSRNIPQTVEMCLSLLRVRKHLGAPMLPRICFIGPRGSGSTSVALEIIRRFNLMHLDFKDLISQVLETNTPEAQILKDTTKEKEMLFQTHLKLIEQKFLEPEFLKHGWIIANFVNTVNDLKGLEKMQTPPNRIIFFECTADACKQRLVDRRVNMYHGDILHVSKNIDIVQNESYLTHPKDFPNIVNDTIDKYFPNHKSLKEYCGNKAAYVNANFSIPNMIEIVENIIMTSFPGIILVCDKKSSSPTRRTIDMSLATLKSKSGSSIHSHQKNNESKIKRICQDMDDCNLQCKIIE